MLPSIVLLCFTGLAIVCSALDTTDQGADTFEPVFEDLDFKVLYRTQTFANHLLAQSISELFEQYQSSLAVGSVRQVTHERSDDGETLVQSTKRKLIYENKSGKLLEISYEDRQTLEEFDEQTNGLPSFDQFYLYENGGSSSYGVESILEDSFQEQKQQESHFNSKRLFNVLSRATSVQLDTRLLFAGNTNLYVPPIDLDPYFYEKCLGKLRSKLHYIFGISRLLLMIECRRQEFQWNQEAGLTTVRGIPCRVFTAKQLQTVSSCSASLGDILRIDSVSVTVAERDLEKLQADTLRVLPKQMIPMSVSLELDPLDVSVLINVYQFETLGPGEHLSESGSSQSDYLIPIGRDLSRLLAVLRSEQPGSDVLGARLEQRLEFSFHGRLSFSQATNWFSRKALTTSNENKDEASMLPLPQMDIFVMFDGRARTLALRRQLAHESGGQLGAGSSVSMFYDGNSKRKYHLIEDIEHQTGRSPLDSDQFEENQEEQSYWRTCASDALTSDELEELTGEGLSTGSLLSIDDAAYMGMALVRGIPSHVYEKRIHKLPFWLMGLSYQDFIYLGERMKRATFHATLFVAAERVHSARLTGEFGQRAAELANKLTRLELRYLSNESKGQQLLGYRLDLHSFDWSKQSFAYDMPSIEQLHAAECLAPGTPSVALSLAYRPAEELGRLQSIYLHDLIQDQARLNELVSRALNDELGISPLQQANLETKLRCIREQLADGSNARLPSYQLEVSLDAFDRPSELVESRFIGFASVQKYQIDSTEQVSLSECEWLAVHSLQAPLVWSVDSQSSREAHEAKHQRVFAYCPHVRRCLVGSSVEERNSWAQLARTQTTHIESIGLDYPQLSAAPKHTQCLLKKVTLRKDNRRLDSAHALKSSMDLDGRSLIEWLARLGAYQHSSLHESVAGLESLELRVEPEMAGERRSISMRATRAMVNAAISASEALASGELASASGLLTLPHSLGYALADSRQLARAQIRATNAAACKRACLLEHSCNSYSVCRAHSAAATQQVECLLSTIEFSSQLVGQLVRRLGELRGVSAQPTGVQVVQLKWSGEEEERTLALQLRLSPLCALHSVSHATAAYKFAGTLLAPMPAAKFLLYARRPADCARFCLERGALFRWRKAARLPELRDMVAANKRRPASWRLQAGNRRQEACTEFYFSLEHSYCELFPRQDTQLLIGDQLDASSTEHLAPELDRWRQWTLKVTPDGWRRKLALGIGEVERFRADFEQLFEPHENLRLVSGGGEEESPENSTLFGQLELTNGITGVSYCARQCLDLEACRSFDVSQSGQDARLVCVLNTLALADLRAGDQYSGSASALAVPHWWHYEPSELGLYALQTDTPILGDAPKFGELIDGHLLAMRQLEVDDKNDNKNETKEDSKLEAAPNKLGFMLAVCCCAFILLALAGLAFRRFRPHFSIGSWPFASRCTS